MNMHLSFRYTIFLIIMISAISTGFAQNVQQHPDTTTSLENRWEWAFQILLKKTEGAWIGYTFERMMPASSRFGSFHEGNYPTLLHILNQTADSPVTESVTPEDAARQALKNWDKSGKTGDDTVVLKKIAVLFYFSGKKVDWKQVDKTIITNPDLPVRLDGYPLIWLGNAPSQESFYFLKSAYGKVTAQDVKKFLLMAIAQHPEEPQLTRFLMTEVDNNQNQELAESAVFWLGQRGFPDVLDFLVKTASQHPSDDVREKAVFAIHLSKVEGSLDYLIDLAKNSPDREIRKKAIFWLGQRASERVGEVLEEVIYSDEEMDVREHGVFALSQLPDHQGVPSLIRIARNHPDRRLRKKAVFWLGQTGDERALQTLIDIVKEGK